MSTFQDPITIPLNQIEFIYESLQDDIGRVFSWDKRIFRAINTHAVQEVRDLLDCGLIQELVEKGLFPNTTISNYKVDGFGLVLEHQKVSPLSYPYEWSFDMYKDAGLAMLDINEIGRKYSYETKDCHAYNIVFNKEKPVFVDLGSFRKLDPKQNCWVAYEQFVTGFLQPLKIWSRGDDLMASSILSNLNTSLLPRASYWYYAKPMARLFNYSTLSNLSRAFFEFGRLDFADAETIRKKVPFGMGGLVLSLKKSGLLPFQKARFSQYRSKLNKLQYRMNQSMWSTYHEAYEENRSFYENNERFSSLVEITKSLGIKTAIEIGGNQGAFSKLLVEKAQVEDVVCTDYDQKAVNALHSSLKKNTYAISPLLYDFKYPRQEPTMTALHDRVGSRDALYALAITHHLTITQKMSLDWIFSSISLFNSEYVFIEFMPLGLYNSKAPERTPKPPEWYNENWFRKAFEKYFDLIKVEELAKNRVLYLGKRK